MRVATALYVCLLPGCLYVGGINHAPEGQVELEQSSARLEKLGSATLQAQVSDPDDDQLSLEWQVQVTTLDNSTCWLTDRTGNYLCGGKQPPPILSGSPDAAGRLALDRLPFRGKYQVTLRVVDRAGASSRPGYTFEVKNQTPQQIKVLVTGDPRFGDVVPDHDGGYPGHAHYLARIDESSDHPAAEADLRCGKKARVSWSLSYPGTIKPIYDETRACNPGEVLDRRQFSFAAASITAPTRITVRARVTDGYGATVEGSRELTLLPNRPACIRSTVPSLEQNVREQVRVIHDDQNQTFSVGLVDDDVKPEQGYRYVWLVSDGKGFSQLPGPIGEVLQLPPRFRGPGDSIWLRVVVLDAGGALPGCSSDTALCVESKRLPGSCYQWVTWKVRFL